MGVNPHEDDDMARDYEKLASMHKEQATLEAPAKKPTKAQALAAERDAAREKLRELLHPGDNVYTILNHVSRSGMSRSISLYIGRDRGIESITFLAARALDKKRDRYDGITMPGCGMDMGFALVYNLGHALWPNGTPKPHGRRNGEPDSDGGYALKQRWL